MADANDTRTEWEAIYRLYLECEDVLWPYIQNILALAVDRDDGALIRSIHEGLTSMRVDVDYLLATRSVADEAERTDG